TVTIASEAEEALAAAMESIFGVSPTIYASAETQRSAVTVFLKKAPAALEKLVPQVRSALKVIRGCGLDTGREKIEVSRVPAEDWSESWKKYFKTIEVGS